MRRDRGPRYVMWTIYGALLILFLVVAVTLANREEPSSPPNQSLGRNEGPTQNQAFDDETATPQPASIFEVRAALVDVHRAVTDRDWPEAERQARLLKERWLSFRTPMQASAGRRTWHTDAINEFQRSLDALATEIAARRVKPAQDQIEQMREIIDRYDDEQEGIPDVSRDPRNSE